MDSNQQGDHKHFWLFEKHNFTDMWDDWYKGKADPRTNDVDSYRVTGRFYVLRPRHLFAIYLSAIFLACLIYVVLALYV